MASRKDVIILNKKTPTSDILKIEQPKDIINKDLFNIINESVSLDSAKISKMLTSKIDKFINI